MSPTPWNLRGICSVMGGFLLHSALSSFYVWGAINIYIISYYRINDASLTNQIGQVYLVYQVVPWIIAMFFTDYVKSKLGLRPTLIMGAVGICLSTLFCSFCENFWLFMLFFGLTWNVFGGIIFMLPLTNGFEYFPKRRGLISGFISTGFGIGPMGANTLALRIINPDNLKADYVEHEDNSYFNATISSRVPFFFQIYTLYLAVIFTVSILMISEPPKDVRETLLTAIETERLNLQALVNENTSLSSIANKKLDDLRSFASLKRSVFSKRFLLIFLTFFFGTGYPFIIVTDFKNYSIAKLSDDEFITWVGSIAMFLNGSLRSLTGLLYDKIGFRKTYFIINALQIFLCLTFEAIGRSRYLFLVWVCVTSVCFASQFVIVIPEVARNYPKEQNSPLNSALFFAVLLSQCFQGLMLMFVKAVVGYFWILMFEAIFLGISVSTSMMYKNL